MAHVYLSLDKLATKLTSVGLQRSSMELRTFAQRFSLNQPLFSIIDVGQGKERADHKIKEMLRTFSDNPSCRHIIFGGCHDAGYLLNFEHFKHNVTKASQITLLETTPAYRGFNDLVHFKRARFDNVFRTEQLPENARSINMPVQAVSQPVVQHTPRSMTSNANTSSPTPTRASMASPAPSTAGSSTPIESHGDSWAAVGKSSTPANGNISIAPNAAKKNIKKKFAYYNKDEQRLDEPLPLKDPAGAHALEARMKKLGKNMCNNWHLGSHCENGNFCPFQHEPRLPPGELNALRHKARSLACKSRYCEDVGCYLGHQCSYERDQGFCPFGDKCHLRQAHGMDRVKYCRYDMEGNVTYAP
ncbi:hypothetical protein ACJQWK_01991 [Exserohilum turcicum]